MTVVDMLAWQSLEDIAVANIFGRRVLEDRLLLTCLNARVWKNSCFNIFGRQGLEDRLLLTCLNGRRAVDHIFGWQGLEDQLWFACLDGGISGRTAVC